MPPPPPPPPPPSLFSLRSSLSSLCRSSSLRRSSSRGPPSDADNQNFDPSPYHFQISMLRSPAPTFYVNIKDLPPQSNPYTVRKVGESSSNCSQYHNLILDGNTQRDLFRFKVPIIYDPVPQSVSTHHIPGSTKMMAKIVFRMGPLVTPRRTSLVGVSVGRRGSVGGMVGYEIGIEGTYVPLQDFTALGRRVSESRASARASARGSAQPPQEPEGSRASRSSRRP